MKDRFIKIIWVTALYLVSYFGIAQAKNIQIEFIGNCGLYMTDGTTNIYIDFPYKSGAHKYMEFEASELDSLMQNSIYIFTHKHSDHYSKKSLKTVLKEKGGQTYGPWNIEELEKLKDSIPEFEIQAFKTEHKFWGISFKHYSYSIHWHGKRIYLSGDTESAETIGEIKDIDWAFVPYWLLLDATERDIKIDTDMFYIYHLASVQAPSARKKWGAIENIHPLVDQGEVIILDI